MGRPLALRPAGSSSLLGGGPSRQRACQRASFNFPVRGRLWAPWTDAGGATVPPGVAGVTWLSARGAQRGCRLVFPASAKRAFLYHWERDAVRKARSLAERCETSSDLTPGARAALRPAGSRWRSPWMSPWMSPPPSPRLVLTRHKKPGPSLRRAASGLQMRCKDLRQSCRRLARLPGEVPGPGLSSLPRLFLLALEVLRAGLLCQMPPERWPSPAPPQLRARTPGGRRRGRGFWGHSATRDTGPPR